MALWIMGFGGTVPIGNLIAGPIIEGTSVTAVMLAGPPSLALAPRRLPRRPRRPRPRRLRPTLPPPATGRLQPRRLGFRG